jgi:hypothetical protein
MKTFGKTEVERAMEAAANQLIDAFISGDTVSYEHANRNRIECFVRIGCPPRAHAGTVAA